MPVSAAEEQFIEAGVAQNVRIDGRGRLEVRELVVNTGVMDNCYGSARVQLGGTEALCCITAEIGETQCPGQGRLEVYVKSTPGVVRGRDMTSRKLLAAQQSFNSIMAHRLKKILNCADPSEFMLEKTEAPGPAAPDAEESDSDCEPDEKAKPAASELRDTGIDYGSLFIRDNRCWVLSADVTIMRNDGDTLTAASIACRSALLATKLPKVIVHGEITGDDGLEVSGNAADATAVPGVTDFLPICVTLGKLGAHILVDPCYAEEQCPVAIYHVGVRPDLLLSSVLTSLMTGSSHDPARYTRPSDISAILKASVSAAKQLFSAVNSQLEEAEGDVTMKP